jgi:glycine cleavage system H protein
MANSKWLMAYGKWQIANGKWQIAKNLEPKQEQIMNIPEDLLYTKEHEWVKMEGNSARIGITDYAQSSLGDITFVQLPETDTDIEKSSVLATVESVKAASDVYAPLSGRVITINNDIIDNPEFVNQSPYEKAWFALIETKNSAEKEALLNAADYKKYIEELVK